ncbi:MAG: hypothetical protein AB9903_27645 [Vulcanimicrobiota bacterium]
MDSLYFRQQMMMQMMPQMAMAFSGATSSMLPTAQGIQPGQLSMALAINSSLGMGWAAYSGGVSGMASQAGDQGMFGSMAMAFSMSTPGPFSMGAIAIAGTSRMGMSGNTIEVAGTGMGQDQKYKMLPGEMLAVYSSLKEKNSQSPEDMKKSLSEKYGIETEIKKDEKGVQTLVNKATGNVIMADGNGNNIMESGDMKFKEAFEQIGLDVKDFEGKDGQAKLDSMVKSLNYGNGMGMSMAFGMGMNFNPFGNSIYGMMGNSYGNQYGNQYGYDNPYGYNNQYGYGDTVQPGMMRPGGMMSDQRQMQQMMMLLMMALQYSTMMQQYGGMARY